MGDILIYPDVIAVCRQRLYSGFLFEGVAVARRRPHEHPRSNPDSAISSLFSAEHFKNHESTN